MTLVPDLVDKMKKLDLEDVTLVVGGIIPDADADELKSLGVAGVYTPRDFELTSIMNDIVELVSNKRG
jgi:(2R)-ethylmalonyl-CoA mutase